jgi:protein gp37
MSKTRIEWADSVWNPVTGCTPISEACENCYAKRMSKRLAGRCGYPKDEPFRVTLHPDRLGQPLHWKKPRRIFVCSMGDLFHEDVDDGFLCRVFETIAVAKQHTFMILTKRPEQMREFFEQFISCAHGIWDNLLLGVTAENQQRANERIPILLQIPAVRRFVSVEPMLGSVDLVAALDAAIDIEGKVEIPAVDGIDNWLHWVICGGETGPRARPLHPDWVRSLRYQCRASGTPFFFKSWGEWKSEFATEGELDEVLCLVDDGKMRTFSMDRGQFFRVGKNAAGRILDGREWNEVPE